MHIDWGAAATIVAAVLVFWLTNRGDVKRRHEENLRKWNEFLVLFKNYAPHEHSEVAKFLATGKDSPLMASGVRVAKNGS